MKLEMPATPAGVMCAVEALQTFAQSEGISEKIIFGLALALEECGSNVVNHALQSDALQKFQVKIDHSDSSFVIELRDRGPKFDPTTASARDLEADDDDPPGGWGIHLVRRYVDEICYRREAGENILRLSKQTGT